MAKNNFKAAQVTLDADYFTRYAIKYGVMETKYEEMKEKFQDSQRRLERSVTETEALKLEMKALEKENETLCSRIRGYEKVVQDLLQEAEDYEQAQRQEESEN